MTDILCTDRDQWLLAADDLLLAQCDIHLYRASGPGGQHRNKTASAVRLRHSFSDITVTAAERRSQHENKAVALHRLREAIAVQIRCPLDPQRIDLPAPLRGAVVDGRLTIGRRDPRHLLLIAWLLDVLNAQAGRASETARLFGLSTSQVVGLLKQDPKRLAAANAIRSQFSMAPLR